VGFELTLPAGILATDIIEVEADFEGASAGANDVEFAIGFKAASDANNQMWDHTIRTVTSTATRDAAHHPRRARLLRASAPASRSRRSR
jgi:hypothetical protein